MNSSLHAGVAQSDITTDAPDAVIRDRLYAKVLVLDDGAVQVVLVTMDAVAIGGICDITDDFLPALRRRIETKLGIPGSHVLVNASHTHPPGRILCKDEDLIDRTFDAVCQAMERRVEVLVGCVIGREDRISMNRNLNLKDGNHWTIRHTNPGPPDEAVTDTGPLDPEIGILRIDRMNGEPLAVVYNFACHLLFADPQGSVSANIPGVASQILENHWGKGTMAFFLQGAAGDVIDIGFKDFHRPRNIEGFGTALGLKILKTLGKIQTQGAALKVISEQVEFPRRTDIPRRIEALEREQEALLESLRFTSLNFKNFLLLHLKYSLCPEFPSADSFSYLQAEKIGDKDLVGMDRFNRENLSKYLANIHAMEKLARIQDERATLERHAAINRESGRDSITAEIQGLRIGEFVLVSAPLEVLTEVALNIKHNSPHKHTFLAPFSNGYMHYGPPAANYESGGYEVIECFLAPEWQQIFETKVAEILRRL